MNSSHWATCVTLSRVEGVAGANDVAAGAVILTVVSVVAHMS